MKYEVVIRFHYFQFCFEMAPSKRRDGVGKLFEQRMLFLLGEFYLSYALFQPSIRKAYQNDVY